MTLPDRPIDPRILETLGITPDLVIDQETRKVHALAAMSVELGRGEFQRISEDLERTQGGTVLLIRKWSDITNVTPQERGEVQRFWDLVENTPDRIVIPASAMKRGPSSMTELPDKAMEFVVSSINQDSRLRTKFVGLDMETDPECRNAIAQTSFLLRSTLMGFGLAALEAGQYDVAITALDVATGHELLEDPEIKQRLKDIAQADRIDGAKIAELIQQRFDRRLNQ